MRHRAQQEAAAQKEADKAAALAARRERARTALQPEPDQAPGVSTGVTALRVRLPDGSNRLRRFSSDAPLQVRG